MNLKNIEIFISDCMIISIVDIDTSIVCIHKVFVTQNYISVKQISPVISGNTGDKVILLFCFNARSCSAVNSVPVRSEHRI